MQKDIEIIKNNIEKLKQNANIHWWINRQGQ
jgi:hypothetical protein